MRIHSILRRLLLIALVFSTSLQADVLEDILERGTIRVAVAEFVPWTLKNKDGQLVGFEIDVGRKLARDMGVKPEFRLYLWEDIIPALQRGEVDIIAGGMAITPARALQVNFSRPTADTGVGIATNTKLTRDIQAFRELDTPEIVVTTVSETFAANMAPILLPNATVKTFAVREKAEAEVISGRAHVYLASLPEVQFLTLKNPETVDMPTNEPLIANSEALAIKKGEQELLNFLNAWVTARKADKWLPTTRDYWFKTLDWTDDVAP